MVELKSIMRHRCTGWKGSWGQKPTPVFVVLWSVLIKLWSCRKKNSLVNQLNANVILKKVISSYLKCLVNCSFATLTHDIKSQFSALLQFRFEIHSVLQFNLPRLHSLFRSQLWKDRNNVLKTFNIFHNLL